jgi:hypothetical protein
VAHALMVVADGGIVGFFSERCFSQHTNEQQILVSAASRTSFSSLYSSCQINMFYKTLNRHTPKQTTSHSFVPLIALAFSLMHALRLLIVRIT